MQVKIKRNSTQAPLAINIAVESLKSNPLTITEKQIFIDGTEQSLKILFDPKHDEFLLEEQPSAMSGLLDITNRNNGRQGYQVDLKNPSLSILSNFDQNSGPQILETFSCHSEHLNITFSHKRGDRTVYADNEELVKLEEAIYGLAVVQSIQDRSILLVVTCNKYKNGYYGERKSHEIGFVYLYEIVSASSVVYDPIGLDEQIQKLKESLPPALGGSRVESTHTTTQQITKPNYKFDLPNPGFGTTFVEQHMNQTAQESKIEAVLFKNESLYNQHDKHQPSINNSVLQNNQDNSKVQIQLSTLYQIYLEKLSQESPDLQLLAEIRQMYEVVSKTVK